MIASDREVKATSLQRHRALLLFAPDASSKATNKVEQRAAKSLSKAKRRKSRT
jgi:prophage tail gpP-like protein